jgi:hypothetical protein
LELKPAKSEHLGATSGLFDTVLDALAVALGSGLLDHQVGSTPVKL